MTPQELAALSKGTRVRFPVDEGEPIEGTLIKIYDVGVIAFAGITAHVAWDDGPTSLIDTKSKVWEDFIREMEVA